MKPSHDKVSPSRRRLIQAALAAMAAPAVLRMGTAFAAYPDRPVRIVVANTPGGPSDIIARIMAAAMQEAMGGSVIVENKGGGGGNIGMGYVARSDADGYTILLSTSAYSVNPGLYNNLPYDPFKDFVAVCELAISPHVFAVMPDFGVSTMKEFVARAKADPDKFNVSTPPIGTTPQLQAEVLKLRENLQKMATVVFPGGGDALKALLSGTVQLSSGVLAPAHPQIKAGNIKGLAVTGPKRWHDLPDIPTMIEFGLPGFRVRHLYRADGAGEDAARGREPAGKSRARDSGQARHAPAADPGRVRGDRQGRQGPHGTRRQGGPDVPRDHRPGRHQKALVWRCRRITRCRESLAVRCRLAAQGRHRLRRGWLAPF